MEKYKIKYTSKCSFHKEQIEHAFKVIVDPNSEWCRFKEPLRKMHRKKELESEIIRKTVEGLSVNDDGSFSISYEIEFPDNWGKEFAMDWTWNYGLHEAAKANMFNKEKFDSFKMFEEIETNLKLDIQLIK